MCGEERAIRASNSDHEKSTALRPGPFRERGLTGRLPERLAGLRRSNEPPPKVDDDAEPALERMPQPAAVRSSRVVCASPPSDASGLKVTAPRRSLRWRRAASDESVRRADASDGEMARLRRLTPSSGSASRGRLGPTVAITEGQLTTSERGRPKDGEAPLAEFSG